VSADENENFKALSVEIFDNDELELLSSSDKKLCDVLRAYFDSNIYQEFVFISGQNGKDGSSLCLEKLRHFKYAVSLCARLGNVAALSNSVFPAQIREKLVPRLSYLKNVLNVSGFLSSDKMDEFEASLQECLAVIDEARSIEARLVKERELAEIDARGKVRERECAGDERTEETEHKSQTISGAPCDNDDNCSFASIERDRIAWEARQAKGDDGTGCGLSIIFFVIGGAVGGPIAAIVGGLSGYLIGSLGRGGETVIGRGKIEKTYEYKLNRKDGEFAEDEDKGSDGEYVSEKKAEKYIKTRRKRKPHSDADYESKGNAGCSFACLGFLIGALLNGYYCAFGGSVLGFLSGMLVEDIRTKRSSRKVIVSIQRNIMGWGILGGIYLGFGFVNSLVFSIIAFVVSGKLLGSLAGVWYPGPGNGKSGSVALTVENLERDDDLAIEKDNEKTLEHKEESDFVKTADFLMIVVAAGGFISGALIYGDKYNLSVSGAIYGGVAAVLFCFFATSVLRSYLFPLKNKK